MELGHLSTWAEAAAIFALLLSLYLFDRQTKDRHEERALGVTHWIFQLGQSSDGDYEPQVRIANASGAAVYDLVVSFTFDMPDGSSYADTKAYPILLPGIPEDVRFKRTGHSAIPRDPAMMLLANDIGKIADSVLVFRDSANTNWYRSKDGYLARVPVTFAERRERWSTRHARRRKVRQHYDSVKQ